MLGGSAFVVAFGMLGSLTPWSRGAALAAAAAVALGYFALADCLRLVRMGAYAAVLEDESSQLDCSPDGIQAN